jgi:Ca2+-binding RTX toxin-like protein
MKIKEPYGMRRVVSFILSVAGLASIGLLIATTATIAFAITYSGTDLGEVLPGTPSADTIYGNGGDDRILGLGGGDQLYGGAGNDKLEGAEGNDRLTGGKGRDAFYCGPGTDTIADFNKEAGDRKASDCERF